MVGKTPTLHPVFSRLRDNGPMDNDDATIGTILSRREALALVSRAGVGLAFGGALAFDAKAAFQAKAHRAVKLVASPALTEGPFFVDERLDRANLLEGTTRPAVVDGLPLALELTVYRLEGGGYAPMPGVTVDVWHCDAHGVYSDTDAPMNHERTAGQRWLRGLQTTDTAGVVRFRTIFPGWYPGRTTHIHFKIRQKGADGKTREFTSQLFFDDKTADAIFAKAPYLPPARREVRNADDGIYGERQVDGTVAGEHLLPTLSAAPGGRGHVARFAIALTDSSLRAGGRRGFGGPGGPPDWP